MAKPKYNLNKITEEFITKGFFSEYLPPCFNIDADFDIINEKSLSQQRDHVNPYIYNMSRFTDKSKRRHIHLPEFSSYIAVSQFIKSEDFLCELIDYSSKSKHSFSKLTQQDGSITRHDRIYSKRSAYAKVDEFSNSTFIPNVVKKINRAKGAVGILYLDISNYYGSIYTHLFPAILLGYEQAIEQYNIYSANKQDSRVTETYKKYLQLDKTIRAMNGGRTNGLLVGILSSQFIAETLLTRIDEEIESKGINFVRYADDYEIFIYEDSEIEYATGEIEKILSKYHLSINHEKTKYVEFPYYVVENLENLYLDFAQKSLNQNELMDIFNRFFLLEKNGVKGAIRFFIKSIDGSTNIQDYCLFFSYIINTLVNDNRSLTKVCELIIKDKTRLKPQKEHFEIIQRLLLRCVKENKDLEVVWLLYILKELDVQKIDKTIISHVLKSQNELAKIIILSHTKESFTKNQKQHIIKHAESWILNYQLFFEDFISKEEFKNKTGIAHNLAYYSALKKKGFSFYKSDFSLASMAPTEPTVEVTIDELQKNLSAEPPSSKFQI